MKPRAMVSHSMANERELAVIREILDDELETNQAATALFVGLDRTRKFPSSPDEWVRFAQTGLREALLEHLEEPKVDRLLLRLVSVLSSPSRSSAPARQSQMPTRELPKLMGPAKVLVVAASSRLSRMLQGALGNQVIPMAVGHAARVGAFIRDFEPGVLVVDLTDIIHGLDANIIDGLPSGGLVVLWGPASAQATELIRELGAKQIRAVRLDRGEGVPPLIDFIRSAASED